jgi:hypothetical protein
VLEKLRRRIGQSIEEMDDARLVDRCSVVEGLTPIADAPARAMIRVGGEVQGLQVVPRAGSPSLEVTISDGTGRAVAVFTGRKRLGGLDPGRIIVLDGVARQEPGRKLLLNPAYTLIP